MNNRYSNRRRKAKKKKRRSRKNMKRGKLITIYNNIRFLKLMKQMKNLCGNGKRSQKNPWRKLKRKIPNVSISIIK